MAKYARKRKGTKRGTTRRTRSKRSVARRRLRRGKMDSSNTMGVSKAIWNLMDEHERLEIINKSAVARIVALQQAIGRAALRGQDTEKLKKKLEIFKGRDFHNAAQDAAYTGKL